METGNENEDWSIEIRFWMSIGLTILTQLLTYFSTKQHHFNKFLDYTIIFYLQHNFTTSTTTNLDGNFLAGQ